MYISGKKVDKGLLFLRIGLGLIFIRHAFPKVTGGPEKWEEVGAAMQYLGIDSLHIVFGFLAGMTELFGGIFLIFGLYMIPSLILLICTMFVAFIAQISTDSGFSIAAHPLSLGVVFIALLLMGPGRHSLDHKLMKKRRRRLR